jgi:predicted DNA-binding WGR domain protein
MSDWMVHLEFEEGTSSKFWRARVEAKTLYVNYGKIGSNGQTQVKEFSDAATAKRELDKLVSEKRKKGYQEAGGGGGSAGAGDDDDEDDDAAGGDAEGGDDEAEAPPPPRKPAPVAARPVPAPAAKPSVPGQRMVLEAGSRRVETVLSIDGKTVRMESVESYGSPDAAKQAYDRLKRMLGGEGYKAG